MKTNKPKKSESQNNFIIPEKYQNYIFPVLIGLSIFIFLWAAITGGGFLASDNISYYSFSNYLKDANEAGEFPLWSPHIFSGLPIFEALLATGERSWDFITVFLLEITKFFGVIFSSEVARVGTFYILYGIGIYFLQLKLGTDKVISFITSLAAVFSTSVIIWIMIGHNTKPWVLAMLPYVFLSVLSLREKVTILKAALLVIGLHFMFEGTHMQMLFYTGLSLGLFYLISIISEIKSGEHKTLKSLPIIIVCFLIALTMSSDRILSTRAYTPHSTRGSAPTMSEGAEDKSGGNTYEYATSFSFSPSEMITFISPSFYGFGKLEYDKNAPENSGKILSQVVPPSGKFYSYWGQKQIEDAPPYFGIIIFLLAIFGSIWGWRHLFVKFLAILSVFAVLLSFGYTFSIIYDFFFYYVPLFNKFRAPSMALVMLHFSAPILAGFGISEIMKLRNLTSSESKKKLNIFLISSSVVMIMALVFTGLFEETYKSSINTARIFGGIGEQYFATVSAEYTDWLFNYVKTEWFANGFLTLISGVLVFLFVRKKINFNLFSIILLLIILTDLIRIDRKPYEVSDRDVIAENFPRLDWVEFLKQDKAIFRVADFTNPSNSNSMAYYGLQNVNGYHSAKLRLYQDLLDITSGGSTHNLQSPFLWNLLNVKYIIAKQAFPGYEEIFKSKQTGASVMFNHGAMPRAFFANNYEVEDLKTTLKRYDPKVAPFNPFQIAYLEKELNTKIDKGDSTVFAKVSQFRNEYISFDLKANGNNLLVISEVWHPNWNAYIDGEKTEIYRTNFAFRSVIVPEGEHKLELKYEVPAFEIGKNISFASNIIVFIALIFGFYQKQKGSKNAK